jgi:hypothetical protein
VTKAWVITRKLTEEQSNNLDISDLKAEKDSNFYEAIKIKQGFIQLGVECKIVRLDDLKTENYISRMKRNEIPNIVYIQCITFRAKMYIKSVLTDFFLYQNTNINIYD